MVKKTNLKSWAVISVLLAGILCATASGEVIYVDADADPCGDGLSWGTAYKYLQDGLAVAQDGNDIWVADGIYKPDEDEGGNVDPNDRTETFQLINGVEIYGGFAGGESSLEERDWETYETILSGDIGTEGVSGDNSYHVVTGSGTDANAVLDGFTITAGNANGSDPPNNKAGGMYNYQGSPTVTNCTFSGNSAGSGGGGGMNNYEYSSPTVTNCTFIGNSGASGGGMLNYENSSPTVTNCAFISNSSINSGGMHNSTGSNAAVTNCTFSGNSASSTGGGMMNSACSPTVTNCTFSGNSASVYGGGIHNYINGNSTVTNCVLWGNTAAIGPEIRNYSSTPAVSYSDIKGGYGGTGNINADPLFADADLRLSAGSPCIDAGDNTAVPGGVTTDLDGKERFIEDPFTADTGNGTPPIVDMGAYEYDAGIIFVDADASGANDGSSWANAFNYLQDALAEANSNPDVNEVWVAEGTYRPDANSSEPNGSGQREATFQLISGVAIFGGVCRGRCGRLE